MTDQEPIELSSNLDSTNDSLISYRAEAVNLAEKAGDFIGLDVDTLVEKCNEILTCLRTQEKTSMNSINILAHEQARRNRSSGRLISVLERYVHTLLVLIYEQNYYIINLKMSKEYVQVAWTVSIWLCNQSRTILHEELWIGFVSS